MNCVRPQLIIQIRKLTEEEKIVLLAVVSFSYNLITLFINTIVNLFIPNTPWDTVFCMAIYAMIIVLAIPEVLRRLCMADIVVLLLVPVVLLLNTVIHPETVKYATDNVTLFMLSVFPFYFLARTISDCQLVIKWLSNLSKYMIAIAVAYYFLHLTLGNTVSYDNMSFAYYLLPFVIMQVYTMIDSFSLHKLLFALLGCIQLIICGTRGPILCLLVFLMIYLCFYKKDNRFSVKNIVFFVLLIIVYSYSTEMVTILSTLLSKIGFQSRVLDMIISESILDDSVRSMYYNTAWQAINKKLIFGYGIYGDRIVLNGNYTHNFILELLCFFGIWGIIPVIYMFFKPMRIISNIEIDSSYRVLVVLLFCVSVVHLMVSGSIMHSAEFFMLLGLLTQSQRQTWQMRGDIE